MKHLSIALLQLLPFSPEDESYLEKNLKKGLEACCQAKEKGADIALFPEMWNCGYKIPQSPQQQKRLAISSESHYLQEFRKAAADLNMAIGITFLEDYDPLPRNSFTLIDRHGHSLFTYAKVHTCDFGDERSLTPGSQFYTADLDTACGPVNIGAMICYDREFPESARILMLKGAEIILVPNACPMEINRLSQLRGRAYENMTAIATCNYPKGQPDCNGHSTIFDGIAYLPEMDGSRDTCILEAGEQEGIYLASLDLDLLRHYREEEVHGNAYRRPSLYYPLIEKDKKPPFIRKDYRQSPL